MRTQFVGITWWVMRTDYASASIRCGAAIPREQVRNTLRDWKRVVASRADEPTLDDLFAISLIPGQF